MRRRQAMVRTRKVTIKDAAYQVMEQAYLKASGGGTLPALARQVMYAARPIIQEMTGEFLSDQYFTQGSCRITFRNTASSGTSSSMREGISTNRTPNKGCHSEQSRFGAS